MSLFASNRRLNVTFVVVAMMAYLAITLAAPSGANQYHLQPVTIVLLSVTVIGLWVATIFFGLQSWLVLDRYARLQPKTIEQQAFGKIASGMRLLAYSLLVSSIFSASTPYFKNDPRAAAMLTQINEYIILIFPFLGFWLLRQGSNRLAVTAQAALSLWAKVLTVGPPVLVLAAFYVFLAVTNSAPGAPAVASGPLAFIVLPLNIMLVVGSWVWGLLAALNIERATHGGAAASNSRPLVHLYNGILTVTGGFIILDALSSLGTPRIADLPLGVILALVYAFIAVIGLGFMIVSASGKELMAGAEKGKR